MAVSATHALALRRFCVGAWALAASTAAHRYAVGDLDTTTATPVVWAGLLAMMTLVGGRHRWRPRGFGGSLVAMVLVQAAVHVAMSAAPWAFGLAPHHEPCGAGWRDPPPRRGPAAPPCPYGGRREIAGAPYPPAAARP